MEDITKSDYEKLISYLTLNSVNKVKYLEQKLQEKNNEIKELKRNQKIKIKKIEHGEIIMDVEYIKNNYHFETLTDEHDLSDFSCDSEDLNDFLKNDALPQQKKN